MIGAIWTPAGGIPPGGYGQPSYDFFAGAAGPTSPPPVQISADATQIVIEWEEPADNGSWGGNTDATGTVGPNSKFRYTANQLSAASWATWVAQAQAILAAVDFPIWGSGYFSAFNPYPGGAGWLLIPTSTGFCTTTYPYDSWGFGGSFVLAAANVMAIRFQGTGDFLNPGLEFIGPFPNVPPLNAWSQDFWTNSLSGASDHSGSASVPVMKNCGACVCTKSRWQLLGLAPNNPAISFAAYNHRGVWAQLQQALGANGVRGQTDSKSSQTARGLTLATITGIKIWFFAVRGGTSYGICPSHQSKRIPTALLGSEKCLIAGSRNERQ